VHIGRRLLVEVQLQFAVAAERGCQWILRDVLDALRDVARDQVIGELGQPLDVVLLDPPRRIRRDRHPPLAGELFRDVDYVLSRGA
jgi:hypothetical protein